MDSPPPSPLSEILENISMQRTPLKSFSTNVSMHSTSKSPYPSSSLFEKSSGIAASHGQSYRASAYIPSTSNSTSIDLLQARIEHLERERVDLSLKVHQRDEKDRSYRIKIEQLELQLKNSEDSRYDLQNIIETCRREVAVVNAHKCKLERDYHELQQSTTHQAALESETLWSKITASARELTRVEEQYKSLQVINEDLSKSNNSLHDKVHEVESKLSSAEAKISVMTESLRHHHATKLELSSTMMMKDAMMKERDDANQRIDDMKQQYEDLQRVHEKSCSDMMIELESSKAMVTTLTAKLKSSRYHTHDHNDDDNMDDDDDDDEGLSAASVILSLKEKLAESEKKRRKLHNSLQDLRGNVRVFLRCRPFLPSDAGEHDDHHNSNNDRDRDVNGCIKCNVGGTSVTLVGNTRGSGQTFVFDNVFSPSSSQHDVYREVSELVQSALDGYRVCIFSYGQTNSGKTHTMSGEKYGASRGIIPRAVEQLLQETTRLKADGWQIIITTSIIEIYNEDVRDLLLNVDATKKSSSSSASQIKISNISGKVNVTGLVTVDLNTSDIIAGQQQVCELLDHAAKLRCTASTSMNEHSSRSHLLFMVDIQAQHERDPSMIMRGGLRLCDLAGSERLDRTGTLNDATRLKETVNINKSLSSLADVFIALGNKASHIPYRNSKLTTLLQDCLSGDGKALMFVNVSPTVASGHETLCSLRFASQVSQVELGKAAKQIYALPPQMMLLNQDTSSKQQQSSYLQPTAASLSNPAAPTRSSRKSVMPPPAPTAAPLQSSSALGSISDQYNASDDNESFIHDMPPAIRSLTSSSISRSSLSSNMPITNQRPFSSESHSQYDMEANKSSSYMTGSTMNTRSRSSSAAPSKRMSVASNPNHNKHSFIGPQPDSFAQPTSLINNMSRSYGIVNAATLHRSSSSFRDMEGPSQSAEPVFQVPTKKLKSSNSMSSSFTSTSSTGSNNSSTRTGWR